MSVQERLTAPGLAQAAIDHAMREYPRESCGVVLEGDVWGSVVYRPLANVAAESREHTFECIEQLLKVQETQAVLALVHSHPDGPIEPSAWDMAQQLAMDLPWGLLSCMADSYSPLYFWHDDFEPPPLLERPFRYGPSGTDGAGDCAALVRDWYRLERGIRLKEFPRAARFWQRPEVSYRDNLISTGFVEADRRYPEVGDVFLANVRSSVPNHSGIFIGNGQIIHHLEGRLSRVDAAVSWLRLVTDWLRYAGPSPPT